MEFHEKFKGQGLAVLMVSSEAKGIVEKYVSAQKIPYVVGIGDKGLESRFGVEGYPSSFLIDGDGKVVWEGHPMALRADAIEGVLKTLDAIRLGDVPASLNPAKADLDAKKFGDAHKKAQGILAKSGATDAEKTTAQKVVDGVEKAAENRLKRADDACGEGDYAAALDALKYVQDHYTGLPQENTAKDKEKELRAKPAAKKELDAAAALDKLLKQEAAARKAKDKQQFIPLFDAFVKKHKDTKAAARAEQKLDELNRL